MGQQFPGEAAHRQKPAAQHAQNRSRRRRGGQSPDGGKPPAPKPSPGPAPEGLNRQGKQRRPEHARQSAAQGPGQQGDPDVFIHQSQADAEGEGEEAQKRQEISGQQAAHIVPKGLKKSGGSFLRAVPWFTSETVHTK